MPTNKKFISVLLASLWLAAVATASAQTVEPTVTLNQAVLKVQRETGGRVLSAEPYSMDHRLNYSIKVLTPNGHVQKLVVPSEASRNPATGQSTKNPPARRAGSKEKH
jgi:uncharacterized membrane protein YkoI